MDFSLAQRAGHAAAFVKVMERTVKDFSSLSVASQEQQRKDWLEEAQSAEVGCKVHFIRSSKRLAATHALVTPEDDFENLVHSLTSSHTTITEDEFDESFSTLATLFPKIKGWLAW